jgi:hypothetical protein
MKKLAFNIFTLLSLICSLSATSVYAQSKTLISKVEIPFDFSIRDKTLPAGIYRVERIFQDALLIRSEDDQVVCVSLSMPVRAKEIQDTGRLLFHRYGETYFLFQIWEPGSNDGRQFLKSRTERSVERDLAKKGEGASTIALVVLSP